jgi:hypothetical protein
MRVESRGSGRVGVIGDAVPGTTVVGDVGGRRRAVSRGVAGFGYAGG